MILMEVDVNMTNPLARSHAQMRTKIGSVKLFRKFGCLWCKINFSLATAAEISVTMGQVQHKCLALLLNIHENLFIAVLRIDLSSHTFHVSQDQWSDIKFHGCYILLYLYLLVGVFSYKKVIWIFNIFKFQMIIFSIYENHESFNYIAELPPLFSVDDNCLNYCLMQIYSRATRENWVNGKFIVQ